MNSNKYHTKYQIEYITRNKDDMSGTSYIQNHNQNNKDFSKLQKSTKENDYEENIDNNWNYYNDYKQYKQRSKQGFNQNHYSKYYNNNKYNQSEDQFYNYKDEYDYNYDNNYSNKRNKYSNRKYIKQDLPSSQKYEYKKSDNENKDHKPNNMEENKVDPLDNGKNELIQSEEQNTNSIEDLMIPLSELTELLTQKFNKRQIECPICFNKIKSEAKIWSCKQCYGPFHLGCITRWINKNPVNLNKDEKNQQTLVWTCPKCCYCYSQEQPEYYCFCGKVKNPEYDSYSTPHSCGNTCGKMRGADCLHPCNMICHPGPCPPCNLLGKIKSCFCGKTTYQKKCSDDRESVSCTKKCEKVLDCGNHKCQQICHKGMCSPCQITQEISCYCNKVTKTVNCGNQKYSCGQKCDKTLICLNHKCKLICHDGPCNECLYTPDKLKNCPCGRMSLMLLGATNRKSCLDIIPSCGLPCPKKCENGHQCKKSCHPDDCPNCMNLIEQTCRCGKNNRKIECFKTLNGLDEEKNFICEKICQKKKSCGIHKCLQKCCDATKSNATNSNHLCLKICGKLLNCGKHTCELFCHQGECKPCPILINQPLTCACGNSMLNPPYKCGTLPPDCKLPCTRHRLCGHPCILSCHMDECPPCDELIEKICNCGNKKIKNVKCSREVLCDKPCDKLLACGHKCGEVCHKDACNEERGIKGCGKRCGKKREFCDHLCMALCHPGKICPNDRCKVEARIGCQCGNRETWIECGTTDKMLIKFIRCDVSCINNERSGGLSLKNSSKGSYYPSSLVRFAKNDLNYLLRLEEKIEKMVIEDRDQLDFPLNDPALLKKNSVQTLLSKFYGLTLEFYLNIKIPVLCLKVTSKSVIPNIKLSEYLKLIETKEIRPEILPFETALKFTSLPSNDSIEELHKLFRDLEGGCYIERESEDIVYFHFWTKAGALEALKIIKKKHANYGNIVLEENGLLKTEEFQTKLKEEDILIEEIPIMKNEKPNKEIELVVQINYQS